jgi:hypothetical protein
MTSYNPKNAEWYGANQGSIMNEVVGSVFYVHGSNGDDANDGLTPRTPFLTITHAVDQCTAWADDYIFVLSYPNMAAGETFPIALDVHKVHLIGTTKQASPSPAIVNNAGHSIQITAQNVEVAGFNFGAEATSDCIQIVGAQWQVHIHHNFFAWSDTCENCIMLSGQPTQTSIHDNYFGMHGYDGYAILGTADGGCGRINIERNVIFQQGRVITTGTGGINLNLDFGGVITDNYFRCRDNAAGEAIIVSGQNGLITNNHAMSGVAANMTNNPYQEDGDSHWGLNYDNQTVRLPA